MSRPSRYEEHRYLGDKRTLVVHDLDADTDQCAIDEIVADNVALGFGPDNLAEARNRGYRPCRRCIPRASRGEAA